MARGTIQNLIGARGFGFIRPEGAQSSGDDLFFHRTAVRGLTPFEHLHVGQTVEYDVGRDPRRGTPRAVNVRALP